MKRSPELRELSVQHHDALVAARTMRRAGEGAAPLEAAVTRFMRAWHGEIRLHFQVEEEVLLPLFARAVPADDPLIIRTLTEHVLLRRVVYDLKEAAGEQRQQLAAEIGRVLNDHIRFEERVVFPAIETALAGPNLVELGRLLAEAEQETA
jgi:hemerythrin-like domain-containing protein